MSRAFLYGLVAALGAILVALVAAAIVEARGTGEVGASKVSLIGASLACLFVLGGILATQPATRAYAPHCQNCGTRMYATLRSQDRREVLTCFTCGAEWVVPQTVSREIAHAPKGAKPTTVE